MHDPSSRVNREFMQPRVASDSPVKLKASSNSPRETVHGEPVLVYQMGKVASCTMVMSLQANSSGPLLHIHALSPSGLTYMEQMLQAGARLEKIARRVKKALQVRHWMEVDTSRRWKVITLVREPIARRVSCFFHHLTWHMPGIDLGRDLEPGDISRIRDAIIESPDPFFRTPEEWFAEELQVVFGFDVFSRAFPHAEGYDIFHGPSADLLVLRVEQLNRCGEAAMCQFLGITEFRLTPANRACDKPYCRQYRRFLENVAFPRTFLASAYAARHAQHFYMPQERAEFQKRWAGRTVATISQ